MKGKYEIHFIEWFNSLLSGEICNDLVCGINKMIPSLIFVLTTKILLIFLLRLRSEFTSFLSLLFPSCTVMVPRYPRLPFVKRKYFPTRIRYLTHFILEVTSREFDAFKNHNFRKLKHLHSGNFSRHLRKSVLISNIT